MGYVATEDRCPPPRQSQYPASTAATLQLGQTVRVLPTHETQDAAVALGRFGENPSPLEGPGRQPEESLRIKANCPKQPSFSA